VLVLLLSLHHQDWPSPFIRCYHTLRIQELNSFPMLYNWRRLDQIHLGEKESLSRRQRYFINPDHWAPSKPRVHHPDCSSTPRHITVAKTRRRRGWPAAAPSCEPPGSGWGRYDTSASASAFHPSAVGCRAARRARTSSASFRPAALSSAVMLRLRAPPVTGWVSWSGMWRGWGSACVACREVFDPPPPARWRPSLSAPGTKYQRRINK
jgi:hypothetical protein